MCNRHSSTLPFFVRGFGPCSLVPLLSSACPTNRGSMLKPRRTFGISFLLATTLACAFAGVLSFPLQAQSLASLPSRRAEAASRAEEEAQRKVSLSADKIIQILRNEPGLLLEVKKMLVKKAYEQGRILDAADLSD